MLRNISSTYARSQKPKLQNYRSQLLNNVIDQTIKDLDMDNLLNKLTYLTTKINFLNKNNNLYTDKRICSICVTDEIDTVIKECGHTFCNTCTKGQTRCPKCRQESITTTKIYYEAE